MEIDKNSDLVKQLEVHKCELKESERREHEKHEYCEKLESEIDELDNKIQNIEDNMHERIESSDTVVSLKREVISLQEQLDEKSKV